jgi:hypothetical protein
MKWIIFFILSVNGQDNVEQITITQDSVRMFDVEWFVSPKKGTYLEGGMNDVVNKAKLELYTISGNDTIKAYLHVRYEAIVIHIPKLNSVTTYNQLDHKPEYYEKE